MNKLSAMTPKRAGRETMELSDEELPPLPEPCMQEINPYLEGGMDPYKGEQLLRWFSAGQMREYARAILAAHEAKKQPQDHLTQPCGVRTEPGEEALIAQALLYIERRIGKSDAEVTEVMREAMRELLGNAGVETVDGGRDA